jgi:hypothetical protein
MTPQEAYTRVFISQAGEALSEENIRSKSLRWWMNKRAKDEGGLRLTDEGLNFLRDTLNLAVYEVPFPPDLDLKPQVIIYLDKFIDCPYHLTERSITVTKERKAFDLYLFSGDVQKYGLTKAIRRKKATSQTD